MQLVVVSAVSAAVRAATVIFTIISRHFWQQPTTGTVSGAKTDKSAIFPYHLGDAGMPIIEQSPLVMECEVIDTYEIDGFKNYICTIINTYIEEDMLDEKDKPDYTKLKPVLFEMPTYKYLRTGDIIGDCVKMGKAYGDTI